LNHFNETWDISKGYFKCYIPYNAQSRAFTCNGGNNHILKYRNINNPLYPDINIVMNNTLQFDIIGVTEYFDASICLFMDKLYHHLDKECLDICKNKTIHIKNKKNNDNDDEYKPNFYEKHNVPEHSIKDLTPSIINKIERLTRIDNELYKTLVERFLSEIKIIETKYQTSLICDK